MRLKTWQVLAVFLGGILIGCQGQSPLSTEAPKNQTAPALADSETQSPDNPKETARNSLPAEPDSPPVAAVRAVLQGVEAGRLEVLAEFLPASYQEDVEALVRVGAEKMPDEVWTRLHALAVRGAALLNQHPHLGEPADAPAADDAEFRDKLAGVLKTLTNDRAWDRTQWQSFQLSSFLKETGSEAFTAWQNLSPAKSTVLRETTIRLRLLDGDQAMLEFQSPLEEEPRPVEFILFEGKWIPKSLADAWEETVRKGRTDLEQLDAGRIAELADRFRPKLLQIERTLDQMLAAERPQQVQLGWWQIQSLLLQGWQEWAGAGPPPRVEIRIAGELTDDELTDLLAEFVQAADQPDAAEYVTFPASAGTVIQLSPVENFEAFLQRLVFVDVKGHDVQGRSVDVVRKGRTAPPE